MPKTSSRTDVKLKSILPVSCEEVFGAPKTHMMKCVLFRKVLNYIRRSFDRVGWMGLFHLGGVYFTPPTNLSTVGHYISLDIQIPPEKVF